MTSAERWHAVLTRDSQSDGRFVFAVTTTGIYCRPSCPARRPRREHVAFHPTPEAAARAGFRPCKRCRPTEPALSERHAAAIAKARRVIERADQVPTLDRLAAAAGMSRFHFQRTFRALTGVTPREYAAAHRADRVRRELRRSSTVTEAIYGSGFNSNSRFYESAPATLGMTPVAFRSGGKGVVIQVGTASTSLGDVLVAATETGVCAILFGTREGDLKQELARRFPNAQFAAADAAFRRILKRVVELVQDPALHVDLPLDMRGTLFQQKVWKALRAIPPGETATYTQVAKRIGAPRAIRAVASACAANTLAVAVPCHRVIRGDGSLAGYRWGLDRKRALLERERNLSMDSR